MNQTNVNEPKLSVQKVLDVNSPDDGIKLFTTNLLLWSGTNTIDELYDYIQILENRYALLKIINAGHTYEYTINNNPNMTAKGFKPWNITSLKPYDGANKNNIRMINYVFYNEQSQINPEVNQILSGTPILNLFQAVKASIKNETVECACDDVNNCDCDDNKTILYSDAKTYVENNVSFVIVVGLLLTAGIVIAWNK